MTNCYSYLNQIFYIPKKFDIEHLQDYMVSSETIDYFLNKSKEDIQCKEETVNEIIPLQDDSLFWCLFIVVYGIKEYQSIHQKYKNREMEEKQKILNYFQTTFEEIKEKTKQKNIKISKLKWKEVQSDLLVNKRANYYLFFFYCFYFKVNVILSFGKFSYMHFDIDCKDTFLFTKKDKSFEANLNPLSKAEITSIQDNTILVPFDQEKPLKAVSSYKKSDLESLMLKVGKEFPKKITKDGMYFILITVLEELQN